MFSVQASSQGAGQMRPVNSGKLLVECRLRERLFPVAIVDEVVPVRDLVVHRAARIAVAIGDAAIHAAGGLPRDFAVRHRQREFAPVANAVGRRLVLARLPVDLEKTCNLAHQPHPTGITAASSFPVSARRHRQSRCHRRPMSQKAGATPPPVRRSACLPFPAARDGIRPASPSRISAGSFPSARGFPSRASNRCNAYGSR